MIQMRLIIMYQTFVTCQNYNIIFEAQKVFKKNYLHDSQSSRGLKISCTIQTCLIFHFRLSGLCISYCCQYCSTLMCLRLSATQFVRWTQNSNSGQVRWGNRLFIKGAGLKFRIVKISFSWWAELMFLLLLETACMQYSCVVWNWVAACFNVHWKYHNIWNLKMWSSISRKTCF